MPHVTFIHGICNKPAPDALSQAWLRALSAGDGLNLGTKGVTTSMIYWADVMYEKPADEDAFEEGAGLEVVPEPNDNDDSWRAALPPEQAGFTAALAAKLGADAAEESDSAGTADTVLERIPLPWAVKRPLMKALLRDVHHYLFDATNAPRLGATYQVRTEIRRRVIDTLERDASTNSGGPHIVVSHSMGTVIAYDCLMRVPECPQVDGLITIGSPLGLDEIQDRLLPEWSRQNGFPKAKLKAGWSNVYDMFDPVAAADPCLANDFRLGGTQAITDIHEPNNGLWRHDITKYLGGSLLRNELARQLQLR